MKQYSARKFLKCIFMPNIRTQLNKVNTYKTYLLPIHSFIQLAHANGIQRRDFDIWGTGGITWYVSSFNCYVSPYVHSFLYIGIYLLYIYILWTIHYNSWYMQTVHLCMNNVHSYKYIYGIVFKTSIFKRRGNEHNRGIFKYAYTIFYEDCIMQLKLFLNSQ